MFMESRPEWLALAFAAWTRGIVATTVYTSLGAGGLLQALNEGPLVTSFRETP